MFLLPIQNKTVLLHRSFFSLISYLGLNSS